MKLFIDTMFPLAQAHKAYEQGTKVQTRGKIMLCTHDKYEKKEYKR